MKKFTYILGIAMSAALLFSGCMKEDIDELRRQQAENAERIVALEEWQQTVNSNIGTLQQLVTALQDNDYVTGVTTFSTPAPGGYRITFTKSGEATIWNGADGADGATGATGAAGHSPVIGVAQDTDGKYYWTLDGAWLLAGGNKVPVTGEKGDTGKSAYELAVENGYTGTLSEWLASLNGTNGVNGKSAYEQAVDNGYTGTLTEWLASLQGINGTNGKSAYELAVENGYTGSLSDWLASLNGTNGVDGKSAYEQACENGYTGTELDWLYSLTGAPGAIGANGTTPKVAIGSDGYWYISADGTASGTPDSGTGWEKSVKATGDNGDMGPIGPQGPAGDIGPQGPQGDAIFAANGVDNSNTDYVVFTLADGTTEIKVPKYKSIGISFTQPGVFTAGMAQTISYTSTGTSAPTNIRIVDLPTGWKYTVDYTEGNRQITITPPNSFIGSNFMGEATVLVGVDNMVTGMYTLTVTGSFTGIASNTVGAIYYKNSAPAGIVYVANSGAAGSGKVVSLVEKPIQWGPEVITNVINTTDGLLNMATLKSRDGDFSDYPAFAWVDAMNGTPGLTIYSSGATGIWYLPAIDELYELYGVWNSDVITINNWLTNAGGTELTPTPYWSSAEADPNTGIDEYFARYVDFSNAKLGMSNKIISKHKARGILAF